MGHMMPECEELRQQERRVILGEKGKGLGWMKEVLEQRQRQKFEGPFKPTRLRNWEVPHWYPHRPCINHGHTISNCNVNGNLLPGIPRSKVNLWGNYIGTWHYPRKITRQIANEIAAPRQDKILAWKRHCEKSQKIQSDKTKKTQGGTTDKQTEHQVVTVKEKGSESEKLPKDENPPADSRRNSVTPYVPGDLTEQKHRDPNYDILNKYRYDTESIRENAAPLKGYPGTREDFYKLPPKKPEDLTKSAEEFYEKHREMLKEEYKGDWCHGCRKDKRIINSPIIAAIRNFDLAKKLHKENLEHQPLPDTVSDALYRKFQMQRHREPGLALKEGNYASGVAWKAYAGYGPTRCTKLKVFRPKTSICNKIKDSANDRPSSVSSFDKKWRFIRQAKVTPIQLAVCWDLTPENPKDEPKRTPHIDGSNGSMAPAVFSLVHTPDGERGNAEEEEEQICDGLHNYGNNGLPYMYDPQAYRPKTASHSKSSSSPSTSKISKRIQSADVGSTHSQKPDPIFTRLHSNSPEVTSKITAYKFCSKDCYQRNKKTKKKRLCVACEMKNVNIKDNKPKTDFKMAFKAGIPQKVSTDYMNLSDTLRIPKMKDPYKERNYKINSLAPPFSLQNFKRQDYPEHWRLATIYQHSYKPIQARKRPLLVTVFK